MRGLILRGMPGAWTLIAIGCMDAGDDGRNGTTAEVAIAIEPASAEQELVRLAQIEYQTLAPGVVGTPDKKPLISKRLDYLKAIITSGPSTGYSEDNSTRAGCLSIEAQLSALAIGRGIVGSADVVADRMNRLRSLLKQAGYDFDESGNEERFDTDGRIRKGYTPLLQ